ncbi:right-handed parallel beta-helix repeat-containing protein [Candidatus Thorarchaeota archaeon]|nr:MAG: right-handed parallel beta-helix repeat-containing protein [Candidatus Thorarchaeota archaeon]
MKHAHKAFGLLLLLVTPFLLMGIITPVDFDEGKARLVPDPIRISEPSYEAHDPIWILNDTAFHEMASIEEWSGDGSPETPYIIEGYNITSDVIGIMIQHVSVSFEIRGCYISDITPWSSFGIGIIDAPQVSIVDTMIETVHLGMELEDIDSLSVIGCTLTDIEDEGIYIIHCEGSTIDDCTIYDSYGTGIGLHEANNTLIMNCDISSLAYGSGVNLYNSHLVTIFHNEISECAYSGIWAISSSYLTVEDNIIHDNFFYFGPMCGVHLYESPHAAVVGNEIYDNARNGIYVELSDWAYIFDNHIYGNSDHGIDIIFSSNGTILQNDIHGNGWWPVIINAMCGIYLGPSLDWMISDNSIWNNTPNGISMEEAERIQITNNHIFNNTDMGVYGDAEVSGGEIMLFTERVFNTVDVETLFIVENLIHDNGISGIYLEGYSDCSIANNQIYNHIDHGIHFWGDWNKVIGNEIYNCETGIGSYECYNNTFSENVVYLCLGGIYVVNIGSNITDNIVYDNLYGIYMDNSGNCSIFGNDIGWNEVNAFERSTFEDGPLTWYNNATGIGNWWHNYNYTGYYNISSDTGHENVDLYPSRSLDLTSPVSIDYEILETGNTLVWEAYALNPSHYELFIDSESVLIEPWDGSDIEVNVDGLAHGSHTIELEVYHISGHSLADATNAIVEDLTPPSLDGPSHIVIQSNKGVSEQYSAFDPSGIGEWAVNDTVNFAIDSTGLLTNITDLAVGTYTIRIAVSDVYGNTAYHEVTVTIEAPTGGGFPTTMLLVVGGVGSIVVIVVILVLYKKRGT